MAAKKLRYTETEIDGHPVIVLPEHVGAALPESVCFRSTRGRRRPKRRYRLQPFDWKNQVTFYVNHGDAGDVGDDGKRLSSNAATGPAVPTTRKGRPKGSKNKTSSSSLSSSSFTDPTNNNYRCENRSFVYTAFGGPKKCESCDRTYDGDPLAHCLEYHKTACPICGRAGKPPLASHIKSHGTLQPASLTVTCYECYECKEKFGNVAVMAEHVLDEHVGRWSAGKAAAAATAVLGEDVATCCACDSTDFPRTVDGLREHVVAAHSNATADDFPDGCGYCGERIVGPPDLVRHLVDEHLRRTATAAVDKRACARCGVQFDDRTALVDHLVDAHCARKTFSHPAAYRCRVCQANFKTQINVLRHACNKIKSPYCERCDKTFPSKMRYAFHLQFHEHPAHAPMHLHCDMCLAEFDDEYQLYDHIRFRHEVHDKAVCEVCGRTFKSSMGLHIHRRYHNGSRNFTCDACDKSFLNKSTLREHEISHMDVKPFRCHICGQYLSRASRLRSHVKTHRAAESTAQKCYCCGACGFAAPGPRVLAEHANKERHENGPGHHVVRQLASVVKCEYCDSTYSDAAHLNEHRNAAHDHRAGDDSEAFVCVVCSSTFSTYSRLTTHKLTHGINMESASAGGGADRDAFRIPQFFSCQYCAKMCLHYTYFCLHRRLKHPPDVQSYECDECSTDFKTSWKLAYHKKTAHGQPSAEKPERAFQCTVCSRKFVKIGALNLHKTRTHINLVDGGDGNGDGRGGNSGGADACSKYLCHRCGKVFGSGCSLRNHGKSHVDEQRPSRGRPVTARPQVRQDDRTVVDECSTAAAAAADNGGGVKVSKISCPYCARTIDDKKTFVEHVNRHLRHDKSASPACGGIVCELCDVRLENSAKLKYHMNNHVIFDEILLCQTCYVPFLSSAVLHSHVAARCPARTHDRRQQPDVAFVGGVPETPQKWRTVDTAAVPPPLVVDCSGIFKAVPTPPSKALPANVTSPPSKALPANVTSPPSKALRASVVTPPPKALLATATPPSKALLATVTPPSKALLATVTPPSKALPASVVTPTPFKTVLVSVTPPQLDDKSSVLDELLAIISSPCRLAALETVDLPPSNKFNDIFNSIGHSLEEQQK